ncbi:MAG: Ig-like domain-containing protein [Pseudomonadota bacterium]
MATFNGDAGDNTLIGLPEDDTINGFGGNDSLSGLGGTDVINGGSGDDTIQGGAGSDSIMAGADNDTVIHVFADNVGTTNDYDGEGGTDTLRLELTLSELSSLISDLRDLDAQMTVSPGTQFSFTAVNLLVDNFEVVEVLVDGNVVDLSTLPDVIDDAITVTESEAGGDVDINVSDNDEATPVSEVAGSAANVGVAVAGSTGGLFTINADGTSDFDANGEFESLGVGESAVSEVTYGVEVSGVTGKYDIILTQDLSGSFSDDLPNVRAAFSGLFDDLTADGDDVGFGVASFIDKPISPFGSSAFGDFPYNTDQSVSTDKATTQATLDALDTRSGSDSDESQLIALQQIALRATTEIGFRDGAQRFVVLQTDADPHVAGDFSAAPDDDGDTDIDETEDYPTIASVGALLNAANISVIFAISPQQTSIAAYQQILSDLGVNGTVVTLSSDSSNLSAAIQGALDTFTTIETATLTATVTGENDLPDAIDDVASVGEDNTIATTIDLTGNDSDPDLPDDLEILSIDTTGTLGSVTVNADNDSVNYDPNGAFESLGAGETAIDTFTYTVTDGNGGTDTATVSVTVNGANDGPTANADSATVGEDDTVATNIDLTGNDSDPDLTDDLEILSIDTTGTLGTVTVNADNDSVDYDPNGAFEGLGAGETAVDTFIYTVTDGNGGTDSATVSVTVTGANDLPVAVDNAASVLNGATVSIDILGNDSDPDLNDVLSILSIGARTRGLASVVSGELLFDPGVDFDFLIAGETAVEVFAYTITDGNGGSDTALITVTVTGDNTPPVARDDATLVAQAGTVDVVVLANDSDVDGDTLTVIDVSDPANGTASINPDGTINFAPDFAFFGDETITYTISDGRGATDTADITVTVIDNLPPFIPEPVVFFTPEEQPLAADLQAIDPENNDITFAIGGGPDGGLFQIDADTGEIEFLSAPDFEAPGDADGNNVYDVDITVSDIFGSATQRIEITVTNEAFDDPINPPVITFPVPLIEFDPVRQFLSAVSQGELTDVEATDPDIAIGDSLQFSLFGEDAAEFEIDAATGVISLDAPLTDPFGSFDGDAIYEVIVLVEDQNGFSDTQEIEYLLFLGG